MSTSKQWAEVAFERHPNAQVMFSCPTLACVGVNARARQSLAFPSGADELMCLGGLIEEAGAEFADALARVNPTSLPVVTTLPGCDGVLWDVELVAMGSWMLGTLVGRVESRISLHHANTDLLQLLINTLPNPIFVKDREHRWILGNQAFAGLLGQELSSLLGRSDPDLFSKEEAEVFWQKDDEVFAGGVMVANEEALTDATGETLWIYTQKTPVTLLDGTEALIGIIMDITDRKRAEEALLKSIAVRDIAVEATQQKNLFMAKVSHELRTPLTSILGCAELLMEEGELGERASQDVESIVEAGRSLFSLISDVLDMSRLEAGTISVNITEFSLRSLLQESLRQDSLQGSSNRFVLECSASLQMTSDRDRVLQIVGHLLSNANKFTEGGVITVSGAREEAGLCLEVRDTGQGIPDGAQARIFDLFSQESQGDPLLRDGTGLGLAIVKGLLSLLGAQITVESELGLGACFRLLFPERASGV